MATTTTLSSGITVGCGGTRASRTAKLPQSGLDRRREPVNNAASERGESLLAAHNRRRSLRTTRWEKDLFRAGLGGRASLRCLTSPTSRHNPEVRT